MQSFHLVLDLSLLLLLSSSKSNFLLSSLSDILSMPSQPCFLCFDTSTFFTGFIIIALLICLSLSHHIFIATSSLPSSSRLFSSRVLLLPLTSSLNGQQLYILSPSVSVAFSCRTKLLIKKIHFHLSQVLHASTGISSGLVPSLIFILLSQSFCPRYRSVMVMLPRFSTFNRPPTYIFNLPCIFLLSFGATPLESFICFK